MRALTLEEVEYYAHKVTQELMDFDEPISPFATRYPGKLESCLNQPFQTFGTQELYPELSEKVAILFYLITKNHPFENGNKRMAVTTTLLFLFQNGYWMNVDPMAMYRIALSVANSKPKDKERVLKDIKNNFAFSITKRK